MVVLALHPQGSTIENAFLDHGGCDVVEAHQLLDRADVLAAFQPTGGEGMVEGVARGWRVMISEVKTARRSAV